jgi:hypothetical protein
VVSKTRNQLVIYLLLHMREPAIHHGGEVIEGGGFFAVFRCHMYSSIAGLRGVSIASIVLVRGVAISHVTNALPPVGLVIASR